MTRGGLGGGNGGGDDYVVGRRMGLAGVGVVLSTGLALLGAEGGGGNSQQPRQQTHDNKR